MKPKNWILLHRCPQNGTLVYCKDKKWRKCPDFGDYPECAKQYTSGAWALRAVRRISKRYFGEYEAVTIDSQTARALDIGIAVASPIGGINTMGEVT